jgi:23S rRNA (guanine2445-N2)-methyltransferase / 23S rRNA (guanine2069-N7)-methyltransferase
MKENMQRLQHWLVSCPKGMELLLVDELTELGAQNARETIAGVYCDASIESAYRFCLWSRLANRVLMQLGRFNAKDSDDIYNATRMVNWRSVFDVHKTFAIRFTGSSKEINHTQFGARRVKDAIADDFRHHTGQRPNVDAKTPDVWINAHLTHGKIHLAFDFSGESLHRRHYRIGNVPAPLKENLAAAILIRSGWPAMAAEGGALIDPMCGSGTLLIEAAMMVADIAPGLLRSESNGNYGFSAWQGHDENIWQLLMAEAKQRRTDGLGKEGLAREFPEIRGYDQDNRAVHAAQENIEKIGLDHLVRVSQKPLVALKQPTHKIITKGLLVCNPPYGERLGEEDELRELYYLLGERLKEQFPGWNAAVFTGNPELGPEMNLRSHKQYQLFNGAIPSKLLLFTINSEPRVPRVEPEVEELSDGAKMFANRLKKNLRKFKSWVKKEGVECYRLYDADMPEYAVAVDIYADCVHFQEYDPPKTIDERSSRRRLREAKAGLKEALQISDDKLFFKQRKRQHGKEQYQKHRQVSKHSVQQEVREGAATLEVNLEEYLDTGLFLDHRPLRRRIFEEAKGKRVLNLFCYTASISVQAALGGARESLSLDMSQTYLDWAKRNFALNGIDTSRHFLMREDCIKWLEEADGKCDLIILDPPTFSNSKKMAGVLDIQRDHSKLIRQAMKLLEQDGTLYFSNNFRRFKMDQEVIDRFDVENISAQTIDPDFQRNPKIHNCWSIRHGKS